MNHFMMHENKAVIGENLFDAGDIIMNLVKAVLYGAPAVAIAYAIVKEKLGAAQADQVIHNAQLIKDIKDQAKRQANHGEPNESFLGLGSNPKFPALVQQSQVLTQLLKAGDTEEALNTVNNLQKQIYSLQSSKTFTGKSFGVS